MATQEKSDRENATEQPTEKKTQDSIDRGEFPVSREVNALFFLLSAYLVIQIHLHSSGSGLVQILSNVISLTNVSGLEDGAEAANLIASLSLQAAGSILSIVAVFVCSGVLAHLVQSQIRFSPERIKPQFNRISPIAGFSRLFSWTNLLEFAKSVIKLVIVSVVCFYVVVQGLRDLQLSVYSDPQHVPQSLMVLISNLIVWVAVSIALFVVADVLIGRFKWNRNLLMTKQDIKEEHKEAEGNPFVRARRLSIARSRQRKRMMAAVPTATVVVTNPTHFAVALRYVRSEEAAPRVVAKGQDLIALRIRSIAEESGVPIVEDPALARALYAQVEMDQVIPREFYRAVADVIAYLQKRRH